MNTAHTATPYYVNDDGDVAATIAGVTTVIADVYNHSSINRFNRKENAAFIVLACNAYDDLVETLKAFADGKYAEGDERQMAIDVLAKVGAA